MEKQMKIEEKWENPGRDSILLEEVLDWFGQGFEFVVSGGHITAVVYEV